MEANTVNPEFTITKNGVTLDITKRVIDRGTAKGNIILSFETDNLTYKDVISIWGEEALNDKFIRPKLKALQSPYTYEAIDRAKTDPNDEPEKAIKADKYDKQIAQDEYTKYLLELSVKGETISEMEDRQKAALEKLMASIPKANDPAGFAEFQRLGEIVKAINIEVEERKAKNAAKGNRKSKSETDATDVEVGKAA